VQRNKSEFEEEKVEPAEAYTWSIEAVCRTYASETNQIRGNQQEEAKTSCFQRRASQSEGETSTFQNHESANPSHNRGD